MRVAHLTAHLGGGVGKALSTLCEYFPSEQNGISRSVICFERLEKSQFADRIMATGTDVIVCPPRKRLLELVSEADVVQLEFWNHPATFESLHHIRSIPLRLVVWSHISGVRYPVIPAKLVDGCDAFVVTTPCSSSSEVLRRSDNPTLFISSGGGFEKLPLVERSAKTARKCRFGYIGTTNFTKMHPNYAQYIAQVAIPDFCVSLFGDERNGLQLENTCAELGRPGLLKFHGYRDDIISVLSDLDVLIYLLNPRHYGTAEIALLEAMAMGVVPVVLDNPVEREIVAHGVTGLVATSEPEVRAAVEMLNAEPLTRLALGKASARYVRENYTGKSMAAKFSNLYEQILRKPKHLVNFDEIFGRTPEEWFLSCQEDRDLFEKHAGIAKNPDLFLKAELQETTKGSVSHFSEFFPHSDCLKKWARNAQKSCNELELQD